MIGDDDIQTVFARPNKRLMRANPAIDTDDKFEAFARGLFQRVLSNAIAFGEAMRHMISGRPT